MQMNNKFFKGARKMQLVSSAIIFGVVGLGALGLGVYLLINDIKNGHEDLDFCFVLIGIGAVMILGAVIAFLRIKKQNRKPLTEEESAAKMASVSAPKFDNMTDTKLFFHFYGKLNQSYLVEDREGQHVFELNMVKFGLGSDTFEFNDIEHSYKREVKVGKVVTSENNGWTISSRFKIDGVNCWDYLKDRGYELKHHLGGLTLTYYELFQFDKLVAKITPCEYKDPWNEESSRILRMGNGVFRLEIIDANLEDVVIAAFIAARVNLVE